MNLLELDKLMALSLPIMERFRAVEPRPWTREAILLELTSEVGSLAHLIQHWEGFKLTLPHQAQLADDCSDVLFIILRLALHEKIVLPQALTLDEPQNSKATELVLKLGRCIANLQDPTHNPTIELTDMLAALGRLAILLNIDLVEAHRCEMEIAFYYFEASGGHWPRPQPFCYPSATINLARLLWKKRTGNKKLKDI